MLKEQTFGEVSDFQGAWKKDETSKEPVSVEHGEPHWHDSCFNGDEVKEESVREGQLCPHF